MSNVGKPVLVIADGWTDIYPSIAAAAYALGVSPESLAQRLRRSTGSAFRTARGEVCVDYAMEA